MLEERGVQLLHTRVKEIGGGHVLLSDGTSIPTRTVIWAGGLKAASLPSNVGMPTSHGGRIDVAADLTVPGLTGVYALGDFANITGKDGSPLPQLASVAEQSGKWCAKNILLEIAGKPKTPFHYLDKGIMAIIGRNSGVAEVGEHRLQIHGAIAFAAWLGVHAALLSSTRAESKPLWNGPGNILVGPAGTLFSTAKRNCGSTGTTTRRARRPNFNQRRQTRDDAFVS